MEYDIRLQQVSSRPLAVVRRRAAPRELSKVVPDACGTVWSVLRSRQVAGAGRHVAVYWDGQINLDVGVELDAPFSGCGEVVGSATPVGLVATTSHYGPYSELHGAHQAILRLVQEQCTHVGRSQLGDLRPLAGRMEPRPGQDLH